MIGPKDLKNYKPSEYINVTSSGDEFKELSPFLLGPVELYDGIISATMENAWQFSKLYKEFAKYNYIDEKWEPTEQYWIWAENGWADNWAHRYPMGKSARPLFSIWEGKPLNYIKAREQIYIPLYIEAAYKTEAYHKLKERYKSGESLVLFDYDGYSNYKDLEEVVDNPKKKMGHAFVLAGMLEEDV